jgi:hypothetical protein
VVALVGAAACSPRPLSSTTPAPTATPPCPQALTPQLDPAATTWLFARPRAIYDHPQLGPIVTRTFDAASERALLRRAERTGYDVRTLDRAAIAWTPEGVLYLGAGPLDGVRIGARLWERLLSPRRRTADRASNERMEGTLGYTFVAALVRSSCGVAAYAEGRATSVVDRIMAPREGRDPDELLVWHTRRVPSGVARVADDALARHVRELEVRVHDQPDGVRVVLRLEGPLPADAGARLRQATAALVDSPLGDLAGAVQWLTPQRLDLRQDAHELVASVIIPWRALSSLAEGLRGEVGPSPTR